MTDAAATSPVLYPIFFDTEFTDLDDPVLISIALVTLAGDEPVTFYAEASDFRRERVSRFVREQVLPRLEGGAAALRSRDIAARLMAWLAAQPLGGVLVSDNPAYDGYVLEKLLDPARAPEITVPPVVLFRPNLLPAPFAVPAVQAGFKVMERNGQHHALVDATSLLSAWLAAEAAGWDGRGYLRSVLLDRISTQCSSG